MPFQGQPIGPLPSLVRKQSRLSAIWRIQTALILDSLLIIKDFFLLITLPHTFPIIEIFQVIITVLLSKFYL